MPCLLALPPPPPPPQPPESSLAFDPSLSAPDAMDRWAFARPPPPGFFGAFSPRVLLPVTRELFDAGVEDCTWPAVDVGPVRRRPPPPGFLPLPARRDPVADFEVPVPPKIPERAVPPAPRVAASKNSTSTRPRLCSDYDEDLDANLKKMEKDPEERPSPDYLRTVQRDQMSTSARESLVIWMKTFVREYDLPAGTLHSAVAYVDRVLSARALPSHSAYELRLLGAAAVFTAAKYEEQFTVQKLNADAIAAYGGFATGREVLDTERRMVAALGYGLGGPTAYTFVGHFTRYSQGEEDLQLRVQRLAHRLADESLRNYSLLAYLPSAVAASAIFLARWALNPPEVLPWSLELQELTGYNPLELSGCVIAMNSFSSVADLL